MSCKTNQSHVGRSLLVVIENHIGKSICSIWYTGSWAVAGLLELIQLNICLGITCCHQGYEKFYSNFEV